MKELRSLFLFVLTAEDITITDFKKKTKNEVIIWIILEKILVLKTRFHVFIPARLFCGIVAKSHVTFIISACCPSHVLLA